MPVTGQELVDFAKSFVGTIPYKLGASVYETAHHQAADCSSFTQYIYTNFHIDIPRTADRQFQATQTGGVVYSTSGGMYAQGVTVPFSITSLQLGDLLFFGGWSTPANPPGFMGIQHVAIYAGNGKIVEENTPNVQLSNLSKYAGHIICASRVNGVTSMPGPVVPIFEPTPGATCDVLAGGAAYKTCDGKGGTWPTPVAVSGAMLLGYQTRSDGVRGAWVVLPVGLAWGVNIANVVLSASGGAHSFTVTRDDGITYPSFS
jgi:hypothetical protein